MHLFANKCAKLERDENVSASTEVCKQRRQRRSPLSGGLGGSSRQRLPANAVICSAVERTSGTSCCPQFRDWRRWGDMWEEWVSLLECTYSEKHCGKQNHKSQIHPVLLTYLIIVSKPDDFISVGKAIKSFQRWRQSVSNPLPADFK